MAKKISRRGFIGKGLALGAGSVLLNDVSFGRSKDKGAVPLIITSHWNETGKSAVETGWEILKDGGSALDAVEKAANIIELDPDDLSVGYGGLPNEHGVVQLDASIMDGKTYSAGAVACLERIKTPCSVARIVMEHTDHVLLAGEGALQFAKQWGFREEDLMTERARQIWLRWKQELSDTDDWGPPDHLRREEKTSALFKDWPEVEHHYGTTNVLAVDANGDIAGITTTSGLSYKIPGRVGDSPIIGAGLYVDNAVGAAGATGRGEDVIKSCATHYIVMRMKEGRSPQQACEDALRMIVGKYEKVNPNFFPSEKFVAISKDGEFGCARMSRQKAQMSVMNQKGYKQAEGAVYLKE